MRAPEWEPILNLAPDHVDDFMWMYAVELADGTRLQVYKHYWTRNSIHLDREGRAFVYLEDASFVGHNYAHEEIQLKWTCAATKHRITRERSRHVIEHCGLWFWRRGPRSRFSGGEDDRAMLFS